MQLVALTVNRISAPLGRPVTTAGLEVHVTCTCPGTGATGSALPQTAKVAGRRVGEGLEGEEGRAGGTGTLVMV